MSREGLPQGLGELFSDGGAGRVLDVDLPPGLLVAPQGSDPGTAPAYWLSDGPAGPDLWVRLRKEHARSGLWPVMAEGLKSDPNWPWAAGAVSPQLIPAIDSLDANSCLEELWTEWIEDGEDDEDVPLPLAPFGSDWPGLAPAAAARAEPDEFADQFLLDNDDGTTRVMLVPVARSADVVTAVGWQGPLNHTEDMPLLSSVLRSWEDRFGARVIEIGSDTLIVTVAGPPVTADHAERVAAEHFAFCPDNVLQGESGTLRAYAARIREKNLWAFWWD